MVRSACADRPVSTLKRRSTQIAILLAALAALYRIALGSELLNDDFSHLALSRQLVGGDLPARDFVESGITLTYGLSAASQLLFGHRLLAEAIIVALAFFVSVYAVFALVRLLTGSTLAAASSAILLILCAPRGYCYPKIIVYAVAAPLWWWYVRKPSRLAAVVLGVWTALAFFWRPDHGVYTAAGVVLAMVGAHGFRLPAVTRTLLSGTTAFALVLPFFLFVSSTQGGLVPYTLEGYNQARMLHTDVHVWPRWPITHVADVLRLAPAREFAPIVSVGWAKDTPPEVRGATLARHRLEPVEEDGESATRVRLTDPDTKAILALLNDPAVVDTAGIDRSTASIPRSVWLPWERWRFRHSWLRLRLFTALDDMDNAGDAASILFFLLPAVACLVILPLRRRLAVPVTPTSFVAFCAFAVIVSVGLLRAPYGVRTPDGVVMPAILLGCLVAVLLSVAADGGRPRRLVLRGAVVVLLLFVMTAMATVGLFGERVSFFAGDWRSLTRMRAVWADSASRLVASPPLRYWEHVRGPASIRFAQYANACVPPSERLAVLWFAPEIYYYADRLMATRHLLFIPGLALPEEQRRTVEKFNRSAVPIVLADAGLWTSTRTVFPELVADIERDYILADTVDDDEGYLVLVRRGRPASNTWGPRSWPCFR